MQRRTGNGSRREVLVVTLLLALTVAGPWQMAYAQFGVRPPGVEPQRIAAPPGVSMEQAASVVQRQTGGRVLSATPAERAGAQGYEVRVLVDGKRVKKLFVDGQGNIRGEH
jgi:hypothetical protein